MKYDKESFIRKWSYDKRIDKIESYYSFCFVAYPQLTASILKAEIYEVNRPKKLLHAAPNVSDLTTGLIVELPDPVISYDGDTIGYALPEFHIFNSELEAARFIVDWYDTYEEGTEEQKLFAQFQLSNLLLAEERKALAYKLKQEALELPTIENFITRLRSYVLYAGQTYYRDLNSDSSVRCVNYEKLEAFLHDELAKLQEAGVIKLGETY